MELLQEQTGHDSLYWCRRIQALIPQHSQRTSDPAHDFTETLGWVTEITAELWRHFLEQEYPSTQDENMWMARMLTLILGSWYSTIQRAKIGSPSRPVALRQQAYARWQTWFQCLIEVVTDETGFPVLFPGEARENPFEPSATDGSFI